METKAKKLVADDPSMPAQYAGCVQAGDGEAIGEAAETVPSETTELDVQVSEARATPAGASPASKALKKATNAVEKSVKAAGNLPAEADEKARSTAARALRAAAEHMLAAADVVEGAQPERKLVLGRSWNKVVLSEVFSGPNRTRPGWFFAVADCHTESLDIRYLQPVRLDQPGAEYWAESDRSCYSFAVGDTLYDSTAPLTPGSRWGDVVRQIEHSVQVIEASPSSLQDVPWPDGVAQPPIKGSGREGQLRQRRESETYTERTDVVEGGVRFELRHYKDGKPGQAWKSPLITQSQFTMFLRTGVLHGAIQDLAARRSL